MAVNVHFTDEDWARIARDWSAWWAGELERPLAVMTGFEPGYDPSAHNGFASNFPLDAPADDVIDYFQAHLEATLWFGDSWPKWWVNFGPGILAGFVGAKVNAVPDTVWFSPAAPTALADLHPTYDPDNVWWRRVQELTRRAAERWGDRATVGITDLGGNLDILASLRDSQNLLFDLYDAPDEVDRLVGEITALWLRYYDELYAIIAPAGRGTTPWAPIWSPGRCYMLQSDFSYMISPAMFERFVMPDLVACCERLDHAFYHLDGKGEIPHLDLLLSIERLHGIQWQPGDGAPTAEHWLPLLKRIRDGDKLCQVYVNTRGARAIVRALGGRGFLFEITERLSESDAQDFLRLLALEDVNR